MLITYICCWNAIFFLNENDERVWVWVHAQTHTHIYKSKQNHRGVIQFTLWPFSPSLFLLITLILYFWLVWTLPGGEFCSLCPLENSHKASSHRSQFRCVNISHCPVSTIQIIHSVLYASTHQAKPWSYIHCWCICPHELYMDWGSHVKLSRETMRSSC